MALEYAFPGAIQKASGIATRPSSAAITNTCKLPYLEQKSTFHGTAELSSSFPSALTTIEGVPVSAEVLVRYRAAVPGSYGDGLLVAKTVSSPAGEWSIQNLNSALRYDVSARYAGENDALQANVEPFDQPRFFPAVLQVPIGQPLDRPLPIIGGKGAVVAAYTSGAYPSGVSLVGSSLQGAWPTGAVGVYPITFDLTDSVGTYPAVLMLDLVLLPLVLSHEPIPALWLGEPVNVQFSASGGEGPYTYSISAGALPAGLTLNVTTGVLSGVTASPGDYAFTVAATDTRAGTVSESFSGKVVDDPYFSSVVLLASFEGAAVNVVTGATFGTSGSPVIVSGGGKWGDAGSTNNAGSFTLTDSNLALGVGPCTIEFWVYPVSGGAGNNYGRLLQIGDNSAAGGVFIVRTNNPNPLTLLVQLGTGGGYVTVAYGSTTLADNTWTHVALTRDASDVWRLFVGGVLQSTSATDARALSLSALHLGRNSTGAEQFNGRYDDVRITKGVCRYTGAFTPPTAPFDH